MASTCSNPAFHVAVTFPPSAKKLWESKLDITHQLQPTRRSDGRIKMLQRYCDDLCLLAEPAQSDTVVEFFWPSGEHGNG